MAGRLQNCENCSRQSLMSVLSNFVDAVNSMDEKVMVPSRLRDMQIGQNTVALEDNNNLALMPFNSGSGEDLYSYFQMMNAIKTEILSGKKSGRSFGDSSGSELESSDDSSDDSSSDQQARKTAEAFRHHLQGLFGLLHQLTDTAKFLGDAYEEQIGGRRVSKKFAI